MSVAASNNVTAGVRVAVERDVLRVTLDRPERQNAVNGELLSGLHAALDQAEADSRIRMVLIDATGPVFCSGMDLVDAAAAPDDASPGGDDLAERGGAQFFGLLRRLTTVPRVVVSALDGRVTGGGVGIVAASDFVYATERSSFALPELLWGLLPCCVLPFLIRRVGFQPAYAMTLSTLPVSAARAERDHLVDELVADTGQAARRLAARLAKIDPAGLGDAKRYAARLWPGPDRQEEIAVTQFARLLSAPEVRGRIRDFADRRLMPWETR